MRAIQLIVATTLLVGLSVVASGSPTGPRPGSPAPDFSLSDLDGENHSLRDYRGRNLLLVFISARCPISRIYLERIRALNNDYSRRPDTVLLGINSSANESLDEIRAAAEADQLPFRVLRDAGGEVADAFGAERTPAVYVIDQQGLVRYRGRIDSAHRPRPGMRHDLREALDEMVTGRAITTPETVAAGCPISRTVGEHNSSPQATPPASPPRVRLLLPQDYRKMIGSSPGKVVVVNFWATWCGPCVAELPELIRISEEMKGRGVRFVGISADDQGDLATTVVPFVATRKIPYEQFLQQTDDPQEMIDVVDKNWPGTLPATFVYNQRGQMVFHRLGIVDRETLVAEIEKALKKP